MPESKKDPMKWLKQVADLNAQLKGRYSAPRPELKQALKLSDSQITDLLNLKNCFDPPAIDKVRRAAKGTPSYKLSSRCALALAGLIGRVDDFRRVFHEALDMVLAHRLKTRKIMGLVDHILSGKPAKDFDPSRIKRKTRSDKKITPRLSSGQAPRQSPGQVGSGESGAPGKNEGGLTPEQRSLSHAAELGLKTRKALIAGFTFLFQLFVVVAFFWLIGKVACVVVHHM